MNAGLRMLRTPWGPGGQIVLSGSGVLVHGYGCITYLSAWETTGTAPAQVAFYDGNTNNGDLITQYNLSESQSTSEAFRYHVLHFERGLYVAVLSGTPAGSVTAWVDHVCPRWVMEEHWAAKATIVEAAVELGAGA